MEDEQDVSRMLDEGCPNCHEHHARVREVAEKAGRFHRKHKNVIHGLVLLTIAVLMLWEGPRPVDAAFLSISILTELQ